MTPVQWKKNRKLVQLGFRDLEYLPRETYGWDMTLAALAYGVRMDIGGVQPDLNAWAARHGVPGSVRYDGMGPGAVVLWHGTSRERAEKIAEHGLFHKGGVWTARHPSIAHGFCRSRAAETRGEGAMVCVVLDKNELVGGRDYHIEGGDGLNQVVVFHDKVSAGVVEYILFKDSIVFTGGERTRERPRLSARFKKVGGDWVPVQKAPVRFSDDESYSTAGEFAELRLKSILRELGAVAPIEVFAGIYSLIEPKDVLSHDDVLDLIDRKCRETRKRGKFTTYWAKD
jgi:hypothetical protein